MKLAILPMLNPKCPTKLSAVAYRRSTTTSFTTAVRSTSGSLSGAGASSLAHAYLERRNRVGLVSFGGSLRWLRPGMGIRQAYRIVDALPAEERDAAAAILEFTRVNHVDHIVIGARQNSMLRALLGSVSAKIAAEAACTVTG